MQLQDFLEGGEIFMELRYSNKHLLKTQEKKEQGEILEFFLLNTFHTTF